MILIEDFEFSHCHRENHRINCIEVFIVIAVCKHKVLVKWVICVPVNKGGSTLLFCCIDRPFLTEETSAKFYTPKRSIIGFVACLILC